MAKVIAQARFVKGSPRKLRFVANALRGLTPLQTIDQLKNLPHQAAKILLKVFTQAIANAKNNFKISPDALKVSTLEIKEGPRYKRQDQSHSARFDRGTKHRRFSHVVISLDVKK